MSCHVGGSVGKMVAMPVLTDVPNAQLLEPMPRIAGEARPDQLRTA